jgi:hypothetical protein
MFASSKLKIKRAKEHVQELRSQLIAFSATDYYTLAVDKDPTTGQSFLKFEITKSLPPDISIVMGDALHNLHSALDLAISDVLFGHTGKRYSHLKFPVYPTKEAFESGIAGGKIKHAPKEIIALLKDVIKPYKGENDALWALHDLNITDKHIALVEIDQLSAMINIDAEDDRGNRIINGTLIVSTGHTLIPFASTREIQIKNQSKPAFNVLFSKGLPTEGKSVVPTLFQFTELVSSIIAAFEIVLRP